MIYLDVLLLTNFLIAWLLLAAAGRIAGLRARFARLTGGAFLAALSTMILFVPAMPDAFQICYKLLACAAVAWAAFGAGTLRRLATAFCWYAAFNLLLAGLAILMILRRRPPWLQVANLTVYLRVSPWLLIVCAGGCCLAVELLLHFLARPAAPAAAVGMEILFGGSRVCVRAVLDTGCHLQDPITCLPVLLVSYPDAKPRLPEPVCCFLENWFTAKGKAPPPGLALRLIPCATAAGESLLPGLAVRAVRRIDAGGPCTVDCTTVAFTCQSFASEAYEAIYGNDFL